jgi:hypothetical protein
MSVRIFGSALLVVVACTTSVTRAEDTHDVTLSLSAERSDYYAGEPLRLSLTIKNESDHDVYGFFRLWPPDEENAILYRRAGEPFRPLGRSRRDPATEKLLNEVDLVSLPMKVPPRQEKRSEIQVVLDPATRQVVLGVPGDYEFVVESRLWSSAGTHRGARLRSDVARVHVASATDDDRALLAEFLDKDLATLVETWPFPPRLDESSIVNAAAFLDRHPRGSYSDKLRQALVKGLHYRVVREQASEGDKALYERMRAEGDDPAR